MHSHDVSPGLHDIETRGVGKLSAASKDVLRHLIAQRLVLDIDGVVLSLLTEAERSVYDVTSRADFPLGYVISADRAEPAAHADEAALLPAE